MRLPSTRSCRVGRNNVAKLWGLTRRSVCWRTLSQKFMNKTAPIAISTGVEMLWKCSPHGESSLNLAYWVGCHKPETHFTPAFATSNECPRIGINSLQKGEGGFCLNVTR